MIDRPPFASAFTKTTPEQQVSVPTGDVVSIHIAQGTDDLGEAVIEVFNTTVGAIILTIVHGAEEDVVMTGSVAAGETVVWSFPLAPDGGQYLASADAEGLRLRGYRIMNRVGN